MSRRAADDDSAPIRGSHDGGAVEESRQPLVDVQYYMKVSPERR